MCQGFLRTNSSRSIKCHQNATKTLFKLGRHTGEGVPFGSKTVKTCQNAEEKKKITDLRLSFRPVHISSLRTSRLEVVKGKKTHAKKSGRKIRFICIVSERPRVHFFGNRREKITFTFSGKKLFLPGCDIAGPYFSHAQ